MGTASHPGASSSPPLSVGAVRQAPAWTGRQTEHERRDPSGQWEEQLGCSSRSRQLDFAVIFPLPVLPTIQHYSSTRTMLRSLNSGPTVTPSRA